MARRAINGTPVNGLPAGHYNDTIDVVEWFKSQGPGGLGFQRPAGEDPVGEVRIRNDSGADVGWSNVLAVTGVVVTPAANLQEWRQNWVLSGATPAAGSTAFVVTTEPIGDGKIGRAILAGVVPVLVDITDTGQAFAGLDPGNSSYLKASWYGPAQLIYTPGTTGQQWCLAHIGGPVPVKRLAEFTLTAALAKTDATGSATITSFPELSGVAPHPTGAAAIVRNMPAPSDYTFEGSIGAKGLAYFLGGTTAPASQTYQILNMNCPTGA